MPIHHAHAHLQVAPTATTTTGTLHLEGLLDSIVVKFHDPNAVGTIRVVCPFTGLTVAEVARTAFTSPLSTVIRPRLPDTAPDGAPLGTHSHLPVSGLNVYAFNVSTPDTAAFATVSAAAVE
jgi:hypothetical protein